MTTHYIPEWVRLIGRHDDPSVTYRIIAYSPRGPWVHACGPQGPALRELPWTNEGTTWRRTQAAPGSTISITEVTP